jgi:hypothetical protein
MNEETNETPFYMRTGQEALTPFQFALDVDLDSGFNSKRERDVRFGRLVRRVKERGCRKIKRGRGRRE